MNIRLRSNNSAAVAKAKPVMPPQKCTVRPQDTPYLTSLLSHKPFLIVESAQAIRGLLALTGALTGSKCVSKTESIEIQLSSLYCYSFVHFAALQGEFHWMFQ